MVTLHEAPLEIYSGNVQQHVEAYPLAVPPLKHPVNGAAVGEVADLGADPPPEPPLEPLLYEPERAAVQIGENRL